MRHKYFLVISLVFLSLYGIQLNAETEPNNTPEQASFLALNGSDTGTLGGSDTDDWWVVTIPSDGKLVVATLSDATLEIDNYIYDQDKTSFVASYAYSGTHTWDTVYFNNLVAGTYYIKAYGYSGTGAYSITNHFTPASQTNDPSTNDSAQAATTLALNGSSTGHLGYYSLGHTDYDDWWVVTIPSDGKLVIATLSEATLEIDNYIYDQDKTSFVASYAYGGRHTWDTVYFNNLVAGTYYIKAYAYAGYGGYTITNKFTPASYQNDPAINDSAQSATALNLNGSSTGHLGYYSLGHTDYEDWWKVTIPSDGKLVIATLSDPTLEIDNYIYDQDKTSIIATYAYGSRSTSDTSYFSNLTPGTYYIRTYCYSGYGAYKITNNFIPAGYENDPEPNDSIQVAKNIALHTIQTGHLGYYNRGHYDYKDYFAFTVNSVWDTLFIRTDSNPTLELDLYLYNSAGEFVYNASAYGTTELLVYPNLQPGTYYIYLYNYSGYGSYGLIVTNTRPLTPLVSVKNEFVNLLPKDYELKQNYPNPFNPATTIEFAIPHSGFVSLKIFNSLGEEVETLRSEFLSAGNYKSQWIPSGLASGIYFCQIKADNYVKTMKMILMK